ncbi:MAG: thioredoxin family protein [Bacteroidota bacterium]
MKKILYIFIALAFFACKDEKKNTPTAAEEATAQKEATTTNEQEEEKEEELPILTGIQTLEAISSAPYDRWYEPNYSDYSVDVSTLDKIPWTKDKLSIKIFMGTWCEDSQREVPRFFNILDNIYLLLKDTNAYDYELITVDRDKVTPEHLEDGYNITNVPTFIFYRNGKEINRIVESPVISLEKDMLSILSGEDYKHIYAE